MFLRILFQKNTFPLVILLTLLAPFLPQQLDAALSRGKKVTIVCYMNGDNNLAGEVLYAVDMMETVGSSEHVDIIALVDGRSGDNGGYGSQWENTKLLHILKDDERGVINSRVIEDMGEENLGDPKVLEGFLKKSLKYPSEKYIFILFAHGRGIIDTKSLVNQRAYKSVILSPDETGQRAMNHQEFSEAIKSGLSGEKFYLMLFFSCLTNMVEVGYGLQDVTDYIIGSEDEVRMVNKPPGMFQIRGIEPEKLIGEITTNPDVPALAMGKVTIDSFVRQYESGVNIQNDDITDLTVKYPATLALVDCQKYDMISNSIDILAKYLIKRITQKPSSKEVLSNLHRAINRSQKYPSFLNLEYLDLQDFLEHLGHYSKDIHIKKLCHDSINILKNELIIYERHTDDSQSNGVSIFLPSFLVPENIYRSHMSLYENSKFSKDTSWSELIETYRSQMLDRYSDILIDDYEKACKESDTEGVKQLGPKIEWELRKDVSKGKYTSTQRYLGILKKMDNAKIPMDFVRYLQTALKVPGRHHQVSNNILETIDEMVLSKEMIGNQ